MYSMKIILESQTSKDESNHADSVKKQTKRINMCMKNGEENGENENEERRKEENRHHRDESGGRRKMVSKAKGGR